MVKIVFPKKMMGAWDLDFRSFNLAMLAKQVWRLIDELEFLCAKVIGAKYYP
jgi:hypothetical protein